MTFALFTGKAYAFFALLFGFSFGISPSPSCGYTVSLLIGFALFGVQADFCRRRLRSHRLSPSKVLGSG